MKQLSKAVVVLMSSLLMTACLSSEQRPFGVGKQTPDLAPARANEEKDPSAGSGTMDGTMSGGGGNGLDGRAVETYAVKIDTLPEFKKYISPILKKLSRIDPDVFVTYLEWSIHHKAWYIVPADFKSLPREQVGLAYRSEQLAIHTERSIFISKEKYDESSQKDRAHLLLHEMVMAARLLMKQPPKAQCEALRTSTDGNDCEAPAMEKLAKHKNYDKESMSTLDGADHEAVRLLTVHLMVKDQDLSGSSISLFRRKLGFDFPWDQLISNVNADALLDAFRRLKASGRHLEASTEISQASGEPLKNLYVVDLSVEGPGLYLEFKNGVRVAAVDENNNSYQNQHLRKTEADGSETVYRIDGDFGHTYSTEFKEAAGVLDPRDEKTIVDKVRLNPILLTLSKQELIELYGDYINAPEDVFGYDEESLNFPVVDVYVSRDEQPTVIGLEVQRMKSIRKATDNKMELVASDRPVKRCWLREKTGVR